MSIKEQMAVEALSRQLDEIRQHIMVSLKEVRESVNTLETTHEKRTELEEALHFSEARNRAILDTAVDGIIGIDEHGAIEVFNKAAENIFGYSAREVIGKNINMLMPEPHSSNHNGYIADYLRTGNAKIIGIGREVEAKRKDGTLFPVSLAVSELAVGEKRMFTGIVRDLTAMKALEKEKAAFYAMLSHDMKSPLVNIIGFSELLLDAGSEKLDSEAREMVDAISRSGHRLFEMIERMLLLSRLESYSEMPVVAPEKIEDIVAEVAEDASIKCMEKAITLDTKVEKGIPVVMVDKTLIVRALDNLVDNAIKFTPKGGKIAISANLASGSGPDSVVFSVSDDGPGVPAGDRGRIFEKHFCSSPAGTKKGCGLGLSVVKAVAEAHKGRVELETIEGTGSIFRLIVPAGS